MELLLDYMSIIIKKRWFDLGFLQDKGFEKKSCTIYSLWACREVIHDYWRVF